MREKRLEIRRLDKRERPVCPQFSRRGNSQQSGRLGWLLCKNSVEATGALRAANASRAQKLVAKNSLRISNMALYDRKCPSCGVVISQSQTPIWDAKGFPCPACGRLLRTSRQSLKLTWAITLAISIGVSFYFGLRGLTAIIISVVASVPFSFIVHSALGLIFSPPLEPFSNDPPPK